MSLAANSVISAFLIYRRHSLLPGGPSSNLGTTRRPDSRASAVYQAI
jgi:hypothetical protein